MEISLLYELAFWALVVTASARHDFYYIVTSLSFFATRLHYRMWPFARFPIIPRLIFIALSIWCYFLTPAHVLGYTLMDLWAPYSVYPPLNPIEIVHDAGESSVVDVFAIHGLGSNPDSAWTYRDKITETRWLKDVLPKEEGLSNMRVVMVNHRTQWFANTVDASFEDHAEMILKDIESVRKGDKHRPIIFIAHSFGGLLLKQTLILAQLRSSPVAIMTRGILFLGVPHSGTRTAFSASLLSCTAYWRGSSTALLEYMAPGSGHLMSLERKFYDIYAHAYSASTSPPYICDFLEMRSEMFGRLALWPTVDRNSGRASHGDVVQLDTDHRGLNKFRSAQDPNFRRFLSQFVVAFEIAVSASKSRQGHGTRVVPTYPHTSAGEYHIPFRLDFFRNDKFTGRNDILKRLNETFSHYQELGGPNVVILQGIGGIGKTEVAVEYAHLYQYSYSSVFWFDCSTENSLHRSFLRAATRVLHSYIEKTGRLATLEEIAARLGLEKLIDENGLESIQEGRISEVVEAMKNWFSEGPNTRWLLIFDNLDDLDALDIMNYIPRTGWGSILITSRRRGFISYGTTIEISEMRPEEALPFLVKTSRFRQDLNQDELQLALRLLELLEYFPLAIEQAGAYISQRTSDDLGSYRRALDDYLDSYKRNAKMLLEYKRSSVLWGNRNDTVLTTWEVSFNAITKESPEASDLLLRCGFLANNDIFEGMFSLGRKLPTEDTTFKESVSKLSSYSLVRFRGGHDAFSIHPLVQFWARERLHLDVQQQLASSVLHMLADGLQLRNEKEYHENAQFERRIIPHLDNVLDHMQRLLGSSTTEASLLPPLVPIRRGLPYVAEGWYLWAWGIFSDISMLCRHYFLSGTGKMSEWWLAYKLGSIYRNQGLAQKAERIYRWTFDEARRRLHNEHPKALEIAGDLALMISLQQRYDEASDWYDWTLASRTKVLGKEHPSTLGAKNGLALIFQSRGDTDSALRLLMEAFAGRRKRLGENDILTMNVMLNIASVFEDRDQYSEAANWYQRVFTGRQKTLGESHKDTLDTMYDISEVLKMQGEYDEAIGWAQRLLAARARTLGESHHDTTKTILQLGEILELKGQYIESLSWYQQALTTQQKTLGETHVDTLSTMILVGGVLQLQEEPNKALNCYSRALAGQKKRLPKGPRGNATNHDSHWWTF
ncbi:hypothetical protein F5Y10DRAFT_209678 [Nemania abortiva]|nr:hypothetical protein F5Y10DRAFT_209678 [Nemania abortiva]